METTMSYSGKKSSSGGFLIGGVILVVVLIGLFSLLSGNPSGVSMVYPQDDFTVEQIRIIEVVSGHAWQTHGTQVNSAFNCLGRNGSTRSFKTFGFKNKDGSDLPTNTWLCFDGSDWYAVITTVFETVKGNKVARLVTAYLVSKDKYPEISNYVSYLVSQWGAVEIKYVLNAGQILLQPK